MDDMVAAIAHDALADWRSARRRVLRSGAGRASVHAWRIASRRLFAIEALLGPPSTASKRSGLQAMLHSAFKASGRLRDSQVAETRLLQLAKRHAAAGRLARWLHADRPRLRRRVVKRIGRIEPRALRHQIEAWDVHAEPAVRLDREARRCAALAGRRITPRSLHRHRIALKQLRYMSELARAMGVHVNTGLPGARTMSALQRHLGEITDIQVLLELMAAFGRKHPRWRGEALPLRHLLEMRRQRLVERYCGNYLWARAPGG